MKKIFTLMVMLTTALCTLFMTGCNDPEPESIISDKSQPTWAPPTDYDLSSSMTAIIKVDLSISYPDQVKDPANAIDAKDLVAAFIGEQCVGVASPQESGLFFLYISGPASDSENPEVTLRYYSAILKNNFVASEKIPYINDKVLGTVAAPYVPTFVMEAGK